MESLQAMKDNCIRIGDYVTLKYLKHNKYLSAEGILVEDVFVSSSLKFFEEHLFQICPQRQYSATNELEEFLANVTVEIEKLDQGSKNHMDALIKGKENEFILNKTVMKNKSGNLLVLGDTVQLLHVKSGKFITIQPTDLARDEKENMKITLTADGSVMSWLKILPRYKINREGEQLTNNTEILLKVIERSNEFLHCSDRNPPRGKLTEVNSCLDTPSPFRIQVFQKVSDMNSKNLLLTGQLVYIKDPESQSLLAPLIKPPEIEQIQSTVIQRGLKRNTSSTENIAFLNDDDNEEEESVGKDDLTSIAEKSLSSVDEFLMENSIIAFHPTIDQDVIDTNAIWMMEWKAITKGGTIKFRTDKVHFRHFNTGKYLSHRLPEANTEDHNRDEEPVFGDMYKLYLDDNPSEINTLFSINQLFSTEELLMNARAVQLKHGDTDMYLERGDYSDSQKVFACCTTKARTKALSIIIHRYEQKAKISTVSKHLIRKSEDILDIYFGDSVMQQMNRFIKATHLPSSSTNDANTIWPKIDVADRALFPHIMMQASLFVRGYGLEVFDRSPAELSKIKVDKAVVLRRQNMFREQGLVEAMLKFLNILTPVSDWLIAESSQASNVKVHRGAFLDVGKLVLNDCFNLLFELIKNNIKNQLYISDHLLVILSHISADKMAAKVAQELLSSNKELQETRIGLKEITIFADKMREVPMNSMYLQLLQTCCSCLGQGLPKNQDTILSVVFNTYSDILITLTDSPGNNSPSNSRPSTSYDSTKTWDITAPAYELYIAPHIGKHCIRGESLLSGNLESLNAKWGNNKQNRFSPNRLFHRDVVPLRELYRSYNLVALGSKKERNMRYDSEKAVGEFLIAQLNLVAELCLDRNYNSITTMEQIYSYEALITMLKSIPTDFLQRSVAYLLQVLYIDREPQSMVHLPRLTRTMSEIIRSGPLDFVRVHGEANYQFALIQSIISSHLAEIAGKRFSNHSHQLMKILQKLITFNFYGELDKLKEITALLVACLVRDEFDIAGDNDNGSNFNMMRMSIHYKQQSFKARPNKRSSRGSMELEMEDMLKESMKEEEKSMVPLVDTPRDYKSKVTEFLNIFEASNMQIILMCFLLLACGVTIYFYLSKPSYYFFFELGVLLVLFYLYTMHLLLHLFIRQEIFSFFSNLSNLIDLVTLLLYFTYFIDNGMHIYHFAKFFSLLKLPLLIKIILDERASYQGSSDEDNVITWIEPDRYILTSDSTIGTLVKIVQILCVIQRNAEDHALSRLLKAYLAWMNNPKASIESVDEYYTHVVESAVVHISNSEYDDVYIDLLMYAHPELMQATLELLMEHHSSQQILLENANKMQLIVSTEGEEQYAKLEKVLHILRRDADCHELWGKLKTPEHRKINDNMLRYLKDLTETCRQQRQVLRFDEPYEPVKSNQNILRNLGCFELCVKIIHLIESIDKSDPFNPYHLNTRNLALHANKLLYWFTFENKSNQILAYSQLKFLIRTVDEKIDSHKVISAIFLNNLALMESVPKKYISEFVELICHSGKCPQYLSLMLSIITMGDKNVIDNQYEVIKLMASPENIKKVALYFVSVNHPDYARKIRLMAPYLNQKDVSVDDLPPDLAYHLELLQLLSRCTVGREGMTTIEAKVQSLFNFVDIIEAILDPNCLLLARIRLGIHLFNAMLDVETLLPAMKDSDCIWRLIISTQDVFAFAKDELRQIEKNGWENPISNRQKIEYMIVCAKIINSYFTVYYDYTIFRSEIGQVAVGVERITMKEDQANDIMKSIYLKICAIYEMLSPLLPEENHQVLYQALCALNDKSKEKIVANVDNLHESFFKMANDYKESDDIAQGNNIPMGKSYDDFVNALNNHSKVKDSIESQIQGFLTKIEQIPWKTSKEKSNIRFEPLIQKLVSHITSGIQVITHGDEIMKSVDPAATKTDIWLMKMFRTMIENRWGMNIFERDGDGGEEQDDAVIDLMKVYNESGITFMCLDLIAKGIDPNLQSEAIKLLVAMLLKEGGAIDIQKTINKHLSEPGSELFFRNVRGILQGLISWHKWNGIIFSDEIDLPDEIIIVRCLQLFCEGHYQANQDILREQPNNIISINLLDDFVLYLQALDNIKCRTSSAAEGAVLSTVLEVIQGPCEGNQDYFALQTELMETLNKKIRQHPINDCDEGEEMELKKSMIEILQALLEGQGHKVAIYERMLSVLHIDVLFVLAKAEPDDTTTTNNNGTITTNGTSKEATEECEEALELRTEAMVLLQMLLDFRPSMRKELGIEEDMSKIVGDTVGCIEVVWRGELQRRFFHIPAVCQNLAKSTKDSFVLNVPRKSPEDKLYGLLEASKEMYREIMQQERLSQLKIDKIFSKTNQDRASWLSFYIVLIINILFTVFYVTRTVDCYGGDDDTATEYLPYMTDDDKGGILVLPNDAGMLCTKIALEYPQVELLITILTAILIASAVFVFLLYLVVRIPVNYQTYIENDAGVMNAIFYTAMDPWMMYYLFYVIIAIIGLFYHAALTFLLLDFIPKSPTSQSVLIAVYNPRMQIIMTFILIMIVNYIFAIYMVRLGLPYGSPENYMVKVINTYRVFNDILYFVAAMLLLNILKGITIDTFAALRKKLVERICDTEEICFICGIEKNVFNRTLDREAFAYHIKVDQNLWNYIYFIIFLWEQSKDDDDGLETFVRKCIENNDLIWFPLRKAIRLAEHQEKGDVNSVKYKFRKDLITAEETIASKMFSFKDQLNRTINRLEKSLEYDAGNERKSTSQQRRSQSTTPVANTDNSLIDLEGTTASISDNVERKLVKSMSKEVTPLESTASNSQKNPPIVPSPHVHHHPVAQYHGALEADQQSEMHLKVVSVVGLDIKKSQIESMFVRVLSSHDETLYHPVPGILHEISNYQQMQNICEQLIGTKETKKNVSSRFRSSYPDIRTSFRNHPNLSLLTFDFHNSPHHLVHQGSLPHMDLSKYVIKVQILYQTEDKDYPMFLAGISIPLVEILNKAHFGELLHIPFHQKYIEAFDGITTKLSESMNKTNINENEDMFNNNDQVINDPNIDKDELNILNMKSNVCYITVSSIVSNNLEIEWDELLRRS